MERREELLKAAARVYAHHGYRGSTTRRIADEAGVNEVTLFRQFGTKDALIHEAIATYGGEGEPVPLPQVASDPFVELLKWAATLRAHITSNRSLIGRCMSEREEHPQLMTPANAAPVKAATELQRYLTGLQQHRWADAPFDAKAAAAMFVGTLFADAMGRDVMPAIYPSTPARAIEQYTRLLLRAIGVYTDHPDPSIARDPEREHDPQ